MKMPFLPCSSDINHFTARLLMPKRFVSTWLSAVSSLPLRSDEEMCGDVDHEHQVNFTYEDVVKDVGNTDRDVMTEERWMKEM
ncbi:hypothetical protein NDU88_000928 [Pleurodeles waltl]|uniref:Uncharacterized protein n=1 Tax=Pleurodeles waltl TaxID=8319 RepID=A0AAV7V9H1_PLEWA|nr:hypothetical protein NDU88_000928 [Pleurodeles waltl]